MIEKPRCAWVNSENPYSVAYHDDEWGVPVHEDRKHFEMLVLEGAQAGLSWETILKKRQCYLKVFDNFDPQKVATYGDEKIAELLENPGIIRNRLKVRSAIRNAKVFLEIQKEFGSFDAYVWSFVGGAPKKNVWHRDEDIPVSTPESDALSKDLKKRGMNFVGSTIMYAYMKAVGLVDDHLVSCFRYGLFSMEPDFKGVVL